MTEAPFSFFKVHSHFSHLYVDSPILIFSDTQNSDIYCSKPSAHTSLKQIKTSTGSKIASRSGAKKKWSFSAIFLIFLYLVIFLYPLNIPTRNGEYAVNSCRYLEIKFVKYIKFIWRYLEISGDTWR